MKLDIFEQNWFSKEFKKELNSEGFKTLEKLLPSELDNLFWKLQRDIEVLAEIWGNDDSNISIQVKTFIQGKIKELSAERENFLDASVNIGGYKNRFGVRVFVGECALFMIRV
jgi:hypothetical protein